MNRLPEFSPRTAQGLAAILLCLTWSTALRGQWAEPLDFMPAECFKEVVTTVATHFYQSDLDYEAWQKNARETFRPQALAAQNQDEFAEVMHRLLATLNASHTAYYSRMDPRRYQLLGIFHQLYGDDPNLFIYDGVGLRSQTVSNRLYVRAVYEGLPAHRAGIQFGDEILEVDGFPFHPILSFRGKESVRITLQRAGRKWEQEVPVEQLDGRTLFQQAMQASVRVIKEPENSIGYVHAWSYAGDAYQDILREAVLWGELSQCDALVLDLRDGWGGADINFLNLFRAPIARVRSKTRGGTAQNFTGVWNRPVALLTDEFSTSGKELFAYGFQKLKLGKVFGQTTAGAVLAGRPFLLKNGDVLYLAVSEVEVDGQRLEGKGVEPDVRVPRPVDISSDRDPQLEAALEFLRSLKTTSQPGD